MTDSITLIELEKEYPLPDSFLKSSLLALLETAKLQQAELARGKRADDAMAIDNALYLVLKKYIPRVRVTEDKAEYLNSLLSAVRSAKYEFSQVCYDNTYADNVMSSFRLLLVTELASVTPVVIKPSTKTTHQTNSESFTDTLIASAKALLCEPLTAFFFYLIPCVLFCILVQSASYVAIPAYTISYFVHVYLMTNDPQDKKGIELIVLGCIQVFFAAAIFLLTAK